MKDYYALLRIQRNASTDEIRRAHRAALAGIHPDRSRVTEDERTKAVRQEIEEAHRILSDAGERALYDVRLLAHETSRRLPVRWTAPEPKPPPPPQPLVFYVPVPSPRGPSWGDLFVVGALGVAAGVVIGSVTSSGKRAGG